MNLQILLKLLGFVSPAIASTSAFVAVFEEARSLLHPGDQDVAKEALDDLRADNTEGHQRFQAKLAAAARH